MRANLDSSGQRGGHWLDTTQPAYGEVGEGLRQSPPPQLPTRNHASAHTAQPSPSDTPASPTVDGDLFLEVSTTKGTGGIHTASASGSVVARQRLGWALAARSQALAASCWSDAGPRKGQCGVRTGLMLGSFRSGWRFRGRWQHPAEPQWLQCSRRARRLAWPQPSSCEVGLLAAHHTSWGCWGEKIRSRLRTGLGKSSAVQVWGLPVSVLRFSAGPPVHHAVQRWQRGRGVHVGVQGAGGEAEPAGAPLRPRWALKAQDWSPRGNPPVTRSHHSAVCSRALLGLGCPALTSAPPRRPAWEP